jgi:Icc protein
MNRRNLLKGLSLTSLGLMLPWHESTANEFAGNSKRKRALRIAHITDIHLQPEKDAAKKFTKCLHHLQNQKDKPDIIFSGGDTIMDALDKDRSRVEIQWNLWHSIIKDECSLKIEYCIGNHDVWGYEKAKSEPDYGKKYATEMMKLDNRFRSFDMNGWHFIVLDSTHIRDDGKWYTAKLDPEQRAWLENDLKAVDAKTPVMVLSHIPIFAACVFHFGDNVKNGNWEVPGAWMHTDCVDLVDLFYKHPNVKCCISGHMHLLDTVIYNNVKYLCNGSVCGSWWNKDTYHETKAGYSLLDLYEDGTVEREYVHYD